MRHTDPKRSDFKTSAPTFGRRINKTVAKREARDDCSYKVTVRHQDFSGTAQVVNMSRAGMAVRLSQSVGGMIGTSITVKGNEVGNLKGTVRWQRGQLVGVQFDGMTSSKSKLLAYFSFFGKK